MALCVCEGADAVVAGSCEADAVDTFEPFPEVEFPLGRFTNGRLNTSSNGRANRILFIKLIVRKGMWIDKVFGELVLRVSSLLQAVRDGFEPVTLPELNAAPTLRYNY